MRIPRVGRGAAYGDIDNDGDLDVLIAVNGGPPVLLRNDGGNSNHFLRVKTVGTRSNRAGIGAVVRLKLPTGNPWLAVKSGSSYCSQNELPLTFGLGKLDKVPMIEVVWPSGTVDRISNITANQVVIIKEGTGRAENWNISKATN